MEIVHHWKIQWINEDLKINPRDRNLTAGPSSNATHWMPEFSELLQVRTPPTESWHQRALSSCGAAYYSHTPSEFNIEVILSNKHLQKCAKVKPSPQKMWGTKKKKMHHNHLKSICCNINRSKGPMISITTVCLQRSKTSIAGGFWQKLPQTLRSDRLCSRSGHLSTQCKGQMWVWHSLTEKFKCGVNIQAMFS